MAYKKYHTSGEEHVSPGFQACALFICSVVLVLLMWKPFASFNARDPIPPLQAYTASSTKQVRCGLYLKSFNTFNVTQGTFAIQAIVWFAYDPAEITLDAIKEFTAINGEITHKSDPVIRHEPPYVIALFDVQIIYTLRLDYKRFPIDDHVLVLSLSNHHLPEDISFTIAPSDIVLAHDFLIPGWRLRSITVQAGKVAIPLNGPSFSDVFHDPRVHIMFAYQHADPILLTTILLVLLLTLFISLLILSAHEDSVTIVAGSITGLISSRFLIQTIAPPEVGYLMFSDYLFIVCLVAIILTILAGIITRHRASSAWVKSLFIVGIYGFFLCGVYAALLLV